jgi:hypothetical protein
MPRRRNITGRSCFKMHLSKFPVEKYMFLDIRAANANLKMTSSDEKVCFWFAATKISKKSKTIFLIFCVEIQSFYVVCHILSHQNLVFHIC